MMIHEVTPKAGKFKSKKRLGRGPGSGLGKTSGRGEKGAGSRSGFGGSVRASAEGGQMAFFRRIPKRGFTNAPFRKDFATVNLKAIAARFEDGAEVNAEMLVKAGLLRNADLPLKILGHGELTKKLNITAAAFSKAAADKITQAGGTATVA